MNTGIQDAADLSWKLDAVLGGADPAILDSYHRERHPIGRRVLRQSGAMMRAVTLGPPPARLLRNLLAPAVLDIGPVRDAVAGRLLRRDPPLPARPGPEPPGRHPRHRGPARRGTADRDPARHPGVRPRPRAGRRAPPHHAHAGPPHRRRARAPHPPRRLHRPAGPSTRVTGAGGWQTAWRAWTGAGPDRVRS
ncbi:FAD-dependent monooxygenase [Actinomadura madurae]|uniref:FAD-dependent monooxygenase n=1 Tax=Actinomadura madurae TaxID=1993 RepID=UPI0026E5678A|nr:FAD-dependent monooxygenase [Actinomadura madurae]